MKGDLESPVHTWLPCFEFGRKCVGIEGAKPQDVCAADKSDGVRM
jgi:hypothetical protein